VWQTHARLRICHNCDSCAPQGCFRYWKPNLELVKQEAGHREGIEAISFAPSDLKFATASKDSTVKARDPPRTS
jgi:WD40 repeat protein